MFFRLLNKIKTHSLAKKKILITKINKNELTFINKLIKINLIKFTIKYNNKYILILNIFKKNSLIFNFKNLSKVSNIKTIKLKNLKKINKKNKFFILNSNRGVLNNYELERSREGGFIIMYL
jgi:ribosomal protein S8